jgi:hypothetical protein
MAPKVPPEMHMQNRVQVPYTPEEIKDRTKTYDEKKKTHDQTMKVHPCVLLAPLHTYITPQQNCVLPDE